MDSATWPRIEPSADERELYVGTYEENETGDRLEVFEQEGVLRLTLPGSGAVDLIPEGEHVFAAGRLEGDSVVEVFWPDVRLHFVLDAEGGVVRYEWRDGSGNAGSTPTRLGEGG